ncbi:hypothetical protein ACQPYH_01605 [Kribbella sp. CA-245084]
MQDLMASHVVSRNTVRLALGMRSPSTSAKLVRRARPNRQDERHAGPRPR